HDFDQAPALAARHRAALLDANGVAGAGVVALVVGVQLDRGAHDLVVALVALDHVDADGDRLVGLVGDDDALAHLGAAGAVLGRLVGLGRRLALAQLRLLRLQPRAVATPLGGGVLALGLALGGALLGRRLAARLSPGGTRVLEARAARCAWRHSGPRGSRGASARRAWPRPWEPPPPEDPPRWPRPRSPRPRW